MIYALRSKWNKANIINIIVSDRDVGFFGEGGLGPQNNNANLQSMFLRNAYIKAPNRKKTQFMRSYMNQS